MLSRHAIRTIFTPSTSIRSFLNVSSRMKVISKRWTLATFTLPAHGGTAWYVRRSLLSLR